jgi:hypothetical protein
MDHTSIYHDRDSGQSGTNQGLAAWRTILVLTTSAFLFAGCNSVPTSQKTIYPHAAKSPALLPDCGIPVGKIYSSRASAVNVFPSDVERPIVWSEPLRTKSLSTVLPFADCLRICRPSDRFWHHLDLDTLVITGTKIRLLAEEEEVVDFLKSNSLLFPQSRDDAELVLLAFAELCGYHIITEAPEIPNSIRNRDKVRNEAHKNDWAPSWKSLPEGWEVSCVLVTLYENWSSSRYTIMILKEGGLQIRAHKSVFFTHTII